MSNDDDDDFTGCGCLGCLIVPLYAFLAVLGGTLAWHAAHAWGWLP